MTDKLEDITAVVHDFVMGDCLLLQEIMNPNFDRKELLKELLDLVKGLKDDIDYIVKGVD